MSQNPNISEAARAMSALGASKGGKTRAERLSKEQRSEIARNASMARWEGQDTKTPRYPKAIYTGEIHIGEIIIPCAVLEDGTRLLTQEGFLKAVGRSGKPAAGRGSQVEKVAPFLALDNLKPFVDNDLECSTYPVLFQPQNGSKAYGYKAELLPKVCEVYLQARDAGALLKTQLRFATACDILMRGLAHVGITALVDEATGYQEVRDRQALQKILERYIKDEWSKWTKRFPDSFYKSLFRLKGVSYPPEEGSVKRPSYVGHWTNDIVYSRLAPGVLKELRSKNPRTSTGARARKHHQYLTDDFGVPELKQHLYAVEALMRGFSDWEDFHHALDRSFPKFGDTMPLALPEV